MQKVTYCSPQAEKSCTIWPECKKSHTVCPKQKSPVLSGLGAKRRQKSHVLLGSSKKSYALFGPKRCGPCKQPVHTEFSKMLACNFLLKILLKNDDFETFLTQIGQVPIFGFWGQIVCDFLPSGQTVQESHILFAPSRKVLYCLARVQKVTYYLPQAEKSCTVWPECKKSRTVCPK